MPFGELRLLARHATFGFGRDCRRGSFKLFDRVDQRGFIWRLRFIRFWSRFKILG